MHRLYEYLQRTVAYKTFVPKSVTLNDLERRNGLTLRYVTEFIVNLRSNT